MNRSFDFFDDICGYSDKNGFSGNTLNRLGESRDRLDFERVVRSKGALFYVVAGQGQLVKSLNPLTVRFSSDELDALDIAWDQSFLLGLNDKGEAEFALGIAPRPHWPDGVEVIDLRAIARAGELQGQALHALAQARALVLWHHNNPFCPRCGSPTAVVQAGYARRCAPCARTLFPRTDPVAIMLAVDDDFCLLGRSPGFPEKMVSALAGFVEVGETVEEAVRREIFEEAGIRCGRVRYHSSQTWPFPSSLMIGCFAQALSSEIVCDDELDFCGWFSRKEASAILRNMHQKKIWAPPKTAIAHQLVKSFVEGL